MHVFPQIPLAYQWMGRFQSINEIRATSHHQLHGEGWDMVWHEQGEGFRTLVNVQHRLWPSRDSPGLREWLAGFVLSIEFPMQLASLFDSCGNMENGSRSGDCNWTELCNSTFLITFVGELNDNELPCYNLSKHFMQNVALWSLIKYR